MPREQTSHRYHDTAGTHRSRQVYKIELLLYVYNTAVSMTRHGAVPPNRARTTRRGVERQRI